MPRLKEFDKLMKKFNNQGKKGKMFVAPKVQDYQLTREQWEAEKVVMERQKREVREIVGEPCLECNDICIHKACC